MIQELKTQIQITIGDFLSEKGIAVPVVLLERTSDFQFGEYTTNVAMRYAKELQSAPLQIAQEVAQYLIAAQIEGLERVETVAPGFINFYVTQSVLAGQVATILAEKEHFGSISVLQGEKWVIEHTSPNPNKAMHLGHLRNNLVGMGLVRLLKNAGAEVVSDCIYNDRGIAIAKVMYGFLVHKVKEGVYSEVITNPATWLDEKENWYSPAELEQKPDIFITECYVLAEGDMKTPDAEAIVREMVVKWEAGDNSIHELWKHVLSIAYQGIDRTLARLGSHWDKVWYEHEHYQKGKDYVQSGLEKGVFEKTEDGAVVTKLEADYGISDTVILKRDGTSLYITQDLALTDLKKKTYEADKLVWVVGPEQSLAFKQLFAVCEQLGIGAVDDLVMLRMGMWD